jgi:alpha-mannosidase
MTKVSRREMLKSSMALLAGMRLGGWRIAQIDRKRLYIAPDDHTDYFWTADEDTYRQAFLDMLDYYLDLADETEDNPTEHQSRWNCDGYLWLWTYEQHKPSRDFERLIGRIKDGHITVPLNALVVCLGGAPAEAVLRGMYYPGKIERRYNLRFPLAISMENQTLPYGLVSLWAGAGARYSWKGLCGCSVHVGAERPRDHEIYWWEGPDGSRMLMKWYSYVNHQALGGYAEARDAAEAVEALDELTSSDYYPYRIAGAFGKGWDDLSTMTDEFVTVAQDTTNDERLVIVSNQTDFFEDFVGTYGDDLPISSGSYGNDWELFCTTMAEVSASVKRSVEKLRTAEALATLVSLHKSDFMAGREEARDRAWLNFGLYWEHDWMVNGGNISYDERAVWQRRLASEIVNYVDELYDDALMALAGMIQTEAANQRFYVFNPLNWSRTDYADIAYADLAPVHVVDVSTGEAVPSQQVVVNNQSHLRILAQDVPAVGYRVYEIRQGEGEAFADAAEVSELVIENDFYRITVAPRGAITSLIDKTRGNREFVQTFDGLALNDLAAGSGKVRVENVGPVSVTLLAEVTDPVLHTKRLTLIHGSNRIELRNEIQENFGETLTWHFGFNLESPDVWHEEVGAIIRARLLNNDGHYADDQGRYDWLTLNHFADMSGDDAVGVTLSNADCYYMRLGNSSIETLDTDTARLSVFAGGRVDGDDIGIPDQHGDSYFLQRFALQTRDTYDPVAAMRFALDHQNPLVAAPITGGDDYPADSYSFAQLDHPALILWALKPAEDGTGIIARLWNLSSEAADFSLSLTPGPIASASQTTHIETVIGDATTGAGALSESISAHQLKTYLLQ